MIHFNCDYNEGAHERILQRFVETNMEQTEGYGEDHYCKEAADYIRKACQSPYADIHFLVGGTQANLTVIDAALRPHQGAICADTGHIHVHETGAVEACGHKVIALRGADGKLSAAQVKEIYEQHVADEAFEHTVQPKLVYISHPTEVGTLYTKAELEALRDVCDACGYYLFLDGARLGYGLCAKGTDVTLQTIASFCDVFYIGGTKVGALFGEAVVICNEVLKEDFRYIMKQKGGMLAKGRLLGIQFAELFKDGLYFELGDHGIQMAYKIKTELKKAGYSFYVDSQTNQQFLIITDTQLEKIREKYAVTYLERYDETHSVIRICTSWATKEAWVDAFISDLKNLKELL